MLDFREDDLVALLEEAPPITGGNQVDCLGSIAGKDDFPGFCGVEETLNLAARAFEFLRSELAKEIHAAMDVRVFLRIAVCDRIDHYLGFLRTGRAIEKNQRLAMHCSREDREIATDRLDIVVVCRRGAFGKRVHAVFPSRSSHAPTRAR